MEPSFKNSERDCTSQSQKLGAPCQGMERGRGVAPPFAEERHRTLRCSFCPALPGLAAVCSLTRGGTTPSRVSCRPPPPWRGGTPHHFPRFRRGVAHCWPALRGSSDVPPRSTHCAMLPLGAHPVDLSPNVQPKDAIQKQASEDSNDLITPTLPETPIPLPRKINTGKNKVRRVKTIYDCQADNDDELTFIEGEVIVVTGEEDQEWWIGHIEGQPERKGVFPVSFVHILSD